MAAALIHPERRGILATDVAIVAGVGGHQRPALSWKAGFDIGQPNERSARGTIQGCKEAINRV